MKNTVVRTLDFLELIFFIIAHPAALAFSGYTCISAGALPSIFFIIRADVIFGVKAEFNNNFRKIKK